MNNKVSGLTSSVAVLVLFVRAILLIAKSMTATTIDEETQEVFNDVEKVTGAVTFALWLIYGCLGAIVVFILWGIIQNPKRFIAPAIGIVTFLIIGWIGYSMASSEPIEGILTHPDATTSALKWGGTGVKVTLILVFGAVGLILLSSVVGVLKYFTK